MENLTNIDTTTAEAGTTAGDAASAPSDDAALGAVFDQITRDNGSARGTRDVKAAFFGFRQCARIGVRLF